MGGGAHGGLGGHFDEGLDLRERLADLRVRLAGGALGKGER